MPCGQGSGLVGSGSEHDAGRVETWQFNMMQAACDLTEAINIRDVFHGPMIC